MSETSDVLLPLNIYEEDINNDSTWDMASKELETIPKMDSKILCVLYLQDNKLTTLPEDFFPSLPNLMYLDLRNNEITDIPKTIENHQYLTHLLLQNNKITSLPHELGTVNLKVLQLAGNPLMYPQRDVIIAGTSKLLEFLHKKYLDDIFIRSQTDLSDETVSNGENHFFILLGECFCGYNSVIDEPKLRTNELCVQFVEKESTDSDEECYSRIKGKCPRLPKSRTKPLPSHCQSMKYLKDLKADCGSTQYEKMKKNFLRDMALKKHKDLLAARDKILQDRKNAELLKNWRKSYQFKQQFANGTFKMEQKDYPYDTNPEYMTLLTREDIEKDLPDKYKKRLVRKCKPTMPRKSNNDVHLAMKIKKLFENLEAIDLNREGMTPRTEQKVLMSEIKKISEIKEKLMELSTTNTRSVDAH
ncbi:hypothetical protein K1T71_013695 [Dendrolimus kikuchii]|uniref:Uncharacterized protein n=1 Tax=Dendrolimus kikuchii TaxID=765133 RepID=A0ACC1CHC8_9NEOP|nr:hypothetical protein K1T71_013695 [Dendrolimus kikuchii]